MRGIRPSTNWDALRSPTIRGMVTCLLNTTRAAWKKTPSRVWHTAFFSVLEFGISTSQQSEEQGTPAGGTRPGQVATESPTEHPMARGPG